MVHAEHKNSKSQVAIKIISKEIVSCAHKPPNEPFQEITLLEALARANCSNILEFIDKDDDENYLYLVTKIYAGSHL